MPHLRATDSARRRSGILAVVHEARIERALRTPQAMGLDVLLPAPRQVRIEVLDGVELVVEVAIDERRAGAQPRLGAGQGLDHGMRLLAKVIADTGRGRCRRESCARRRRAGGGGAWLLDRRRARGGNGWRTSRYSPGRGDLERQPT